jgi:hypothetical protein
MLYAIVRFPARPNALHQLVLIWLSTPVATEEKVDGTNLGISFHGPAYTLHLQHRGRTISPGSESQYAKLGSWIDRHRAGLVAALGECLVRQIYTPLL